jgi:hypothetical protein
LCQKSDTKKVDTFFFLLRMPEQIIGQYQDQFTMAVNPCSNP